MTNVNLNNAAVTIQKNHGDNSNSDWADNAQINAMTNAAGQGGIFNVSGDKTVITMNSGSVLNAHIFNLNDGKIDLKGTSGDGTYDECQYKSRYKSSVCRTKTMNFET